MRVSGFHPGPLFLPLRRSPRSPSSNPLATSPTRPGDGNKLVSVGDVRLLVAQDHPEQQPPARGLLVRLVRGPTVAVGALVVTPLPAGQPRRVEQVAVEIVVRR